MRPPVTYSFYQVAYGGGLPEAAFEAGVADAERLVAWLIGGRPVDYWEERPYKRAVCAALDAMEREGDGRAVSLGSYSVQAGARTGEQAAVEAASRELAGTRLAYQGLA